MSKMIIWRDRWIFLPTFMLVSFSFAIGAASAQDMKPLAKILAGPKGSYGANYPQIRCAALYSALLNRVGRGNMGDAFNYYDAAIEVLLYVGVLERSKSTEPFNAIESTGKELEQIMRNYEARMDRNYAATGQAFNEDNLIREDVAICKDVAEQAAMIAKKLGKTKD